MFAVNVLVLVVACSLAQGAGAGDVVFAAAKLRTDGGAYFSTESSHLYRIHTDGTGLQQLTFGDDQDTSPCLSADRKAIVFLRSDKDDLARTVCLCSVGPDGSHQTILRSYTQTDTEYVRATDNEIEIVKADLAKAGGIKPLPGDPNTKTSNGGISGATPTTRLDDQTLLCGFDSDDPSLLGIGTEKGRLTRKMNVYHVVEGKKHLCPLFGSEQRSRNSGGFRAFRFGTDRSDLLLQVVARTNDGGDPAIYCFGFKTGSVRFELAHQFLEDADWKQNHFLTTSWQWGKGATNKNSSLVCISLEP
jgi:hypothetical protein